jgi:hypothetical protein
LPPLSLELLDLLDGARAHGQVHGSLVDSFVNGKFTGKGLRSYWGGRALSVTESAGRLASNAGISMLRG